MSGSPSEAEFRKSERQKRVEERTGGKVTATSLLTQVYYRVCGDVFFSREEKRTPRKWYDNYYLSFMSYSQFY